MAKVVVLKSEERFRLGSRRRAAARRGTLVTRTHEGERRVLHVVVLGVEVKRGPGLGGAGQRTLANHRHIP
jgi:hypothetical protein